MEKKNIAQELAEISGLFLTPSEEDKIPAENLFKPTRISSGEVADECEVEESVSVRRRIAYPDTKSGQENIRKCLSKYLDEDYVICRVELKRTTDSLKSRNKKRTEEEIHIFLKDAPS